MRGQLAAQPVGLLRTEAVWLWSVIAPRPWFIDGPKAMKIFALNLSLAFVLRQDDARFDFAPTPLSLMAAQLTAPDADGRQWYLDVGPEGPSPDTVFAWQADEAIRQLDSQLTLRFVDAEARGQWLSDFRSRFHRKEAAGGLVRNERGQYLCIYNRGRWTLPKGHVERGERIADTAAREVCEETGLPQVKVGAPLPSTEHTYYEKGHWVLKVTHWFRMTAAGDLPLTPQADEQIEAAHWLSKSEWLALAHTSYPLNRAIFEAEFAQSLTS